MSSLFVLQIFTGPRMDTQVRWTLKESPLDTIWTQEVGRYYTSTRNILTPVPPGGCRKTSSFLSSTSAMQVRKTAQPYNTYLLCYLLERSGSVLTDCGTLLSSMSRLAGPSISFYFLFLDQTHRRRPSVERFWSLSVWSLLCQG